VLYGAGGDLKGHTGCRLEVRSGHSFVRSVAGEVGLPFSPLNSPLRSSEGRFLLTVLEEEVGE